MVSRRLLLSSLVMSFALACGKPTTDGTMFGPGDMLGPYLAIGDTLAADAVEPLPELGPRLVAAAEGHASEPGVEAIVQGAGRIGAQDLEAARTTYEALSKGMIQYLAAHPEQRDGHVLVHCPMTFDGKGALWVQKVGKIMNPYEGSRMLHCGDKLGWDAELPKT